MRDLIDRQIAITYPILPKQYRKYQTNNLDDAYEKGWDDLLSYLENLPYVHTGEIALEGDESEVAILSILRSKYNLFDDEESPIYHALSQAIRALNAQAGTKGKWLLDRDNENLLICSECDYETRHFTRFCPSCGAKMRD